MFGTYPCLAVLRSCTFCCCRVKVAGSYEWKRFGFWTRFPIVFVHRGAQCHYGFGIPSWLLRVTRSREVMHSKVALYCDYDIAIRPITKKESSAEAQSITKQECKRAQDHNFIGPKIQCRVPSGGTLYSRSPASVIQASYLQLVPDTASKQNTRTQPCTSNNALLDVGLSGDVAVAGGRRRRVAGLGPVGHGLLRPVGALRGAGAQPGRPPPRAGPLVGVHPAAIGFISEMLGGWCSRCSCGCSPATSSLRSGSREGTLGFSSLSSIALFMFGTTFSIALLLCSSRCSVTLTRRGGLLQSR
jgi:hypothetical protein